MIDETEQQSRSVFQTDFGGGFYSSTIREILEVVVVRER